MGVRVSSGSLEDICQKIATRIAALEVFSQFALVSGCWRRPIARTRGSKAQIITPETSKLNVFCFICFVTF